NQIDVDRASANLLEAENQIVMYAQEVKINESQIRILMGMSPESGEEIEKPTLLFDHPFALPDNIPLNLLSRRPDLMAQIWVVESKAQMIKASKAAFFPNINLSAFGGLETLNWNTLFSTNSLAGAITPAINLPLFTGGRLTADLNENYALYDAAVHEYNSLVLTATKEVFDQITTLNAANEESVLQDEIFEKNLKCSTLTLQRYENGLDDYLETLNAQIKVLQEGIKNVEVGNKRFLAALKLIKALGGGYHDRANSK
ncbi:MAG: TolC family protein, partial [Simkaniaceae bacterium]|nr:TolC family protein [Simkaniaceae bacterium]